MIFFRFIFLFSFLVLTTACDEVAETPQALAPPSNQPTVLKVLAGSELKDIEPMLATIQQQTGISLEMHYTGT